MTERLKRYEIVGYYPVRPGTGASDEDALRYKITEYKEGKYIEFEDVQKLAEEIKKEVKKRHKLEMTCLDCEDYTEREIEFFCEDDPIIKLLTETGLI